MAEQQDQKQQKQRHFLDVDATALTPRHVCSLIIPPPNPSPSPSSLPTLSSSGASNAFTRYWPPVPNEQLQQQLHQQQHQQQQQKQQHQHQHGSFPSMPSIPSVSSANTSSRHTASTSGTATATATASYSHSHTNVHAQSHSQLQQQQQQPYHRQFSSASTVGSSVSNSSNRKSSSASTLQSPSHPSPAGTGTGTTAGATNATANSTTTATRMLGSIAPSANSQSSSSQMVIAFQEYLLVPTLDGRVVVYHILDFYNAEHALQEEELNSFCCSSTTTSSYGNNSYGYSSTNNYYSDGSSVNTQPQTQPPTAPATTMYSLSDVESYQSKINGVRTKMTRMQQEKEAVEPIYSLGPFYVGEYYGCDSANARNREDDNENESGNGNGKNDDCERQGMVGGSTSTASTASTTDRYKSAGGVGMSAGVGGDNKKKPNSSNSSKVSASIVNICFFTTTTEAAIVETADQGTSSSSTMDKMNTTHSTNENTSATTGSASVTPKRSTNTGMNVGTAAATTTIHKESTSTPTLLQHHYVAFLTNEGDVHVFEFHSSSLSPELGDNHDPHHHDPHHYGYHDHNHHHNHHDLRIEHVTSFYSGNVGATSLAMFHNHNDHREDLNIDIDIDTINQKQTKQGRPGQYEQVNRRQQHDIILNIVIGYDCGIISCFGIQKMKKNTRNQQQQHHHYYHNHSSILKWMGNFDENCSILSMSLLGGNGIAPASASPPPPPDPSLSTPSSPPSRKGGVEENNDDSTDHHRNNNNCNSSSFIDQYLVVGLGQNPIMDEFDSQATFGRRRLESSPSSAALSIAQCLEVVNISRVEKEWNEAFSSIATSTSISIQEPTLHRNPYRDSLPLGEYTVWPVREVLSDGDDGGITVNIPSLYKKRSRSKKKVNTCLLRDIMYGVNIVDVFPKNCDHAFVASMSDGTIATMHYYKNEAPGPLLSELSWGIGCGQNKVKLPQPACGMGLLHDGNMKSSGNGNSIVACLRDGTVFVIPVIPVDDDHKSSSNERNGDHNDAKVEDVIMFKLPQDSDGIGSGSMTGGINNSDCTTTCHTLGFVAGYVRVRDWGSGDPDLQKRDWRSGRLVPIFFHAWPGGVIDCHACGLVPECFPSMTSKADFPENRRGIKMSLLEILGLKSSDVLSDLVKFLISLDLDEDPANEGSMIHKAAMECKLLGGTVGGVLKQVLSDSSDRMVGLESLSKLINELASNGGHMDLFT